MKSATIYESSTQLQTIAIKTTCMVQQDILGQTTTTLTFNNDNKKLDPYWIHLSLPSTGSSLAMISVKTNLMGGTNVINWAVAENKLN